MLANFDMPNILDKEGFRQQQFLAISPRHHKHYTLPSKIHCRLTIGLGQDKLIDSSSFTFIFFPLISNISPFFYVKLDSANKKVHFGPHIRKNIRQNHLEGRSHLQPSGVESCNLYCLFVQIGFLISRANSLTIFH